LRKERAGQASHSSSQCIAPVPVAPSHAAPPVNAPHAVAPPPLAPATSNSAPGAHLWLPWVPPVASMEFVSAAGAMSAQPSHAAPSAAAAPFPAPAGEALPPKVLVPEAAFGQMWRISESLRVLLLIQVQAQVLLLRPPRGVLLDGQRADCLEAADQLGLLLAPVLAAPAEGGFAVVGQLEAIIHGLRRYLHAGSPAEAIGASSLVVRELWRSLTGMIATLEADRM
ncbi:unnamed protein product, partial [Closterium sp. NIES-53]